MKNDTKKISKLNWFQRRSLFEKLFWLTILVLFIIFIIFQFMAISNNPKIPIVETNTTSIAGEFIEEYIVSDIMSDNLKNSQEKITKNINKELKTVYANIDREMEHLFKPVEANVDRFLDFHYSVRGEYTELGTMALGDIHELIRNKLFGDDFKNQLSQSSKYIADSYTKSMEHHLDFLHDVALKGVDTNLNSEVLLNLRGDIDANKLLQEEKLGLLVAIRFGPKLLQPLMTKLIAKGTAKVATKSASKMGTKMAATATGITASAICGPLVWVCAPIAGVSLWLATDVAVVSADEYLNREEFKEEILQSLNQKKKIMTKNYKEAYHEAFNDFSKKAEQHYAETTIQEKQRVKIKDKF
jgi:hypothetical protein